MTETDKEVEVLMADPATSFWLKKSLTTALDRDPVDAFHDAQVLCRIVSTRAAETLERALCQIPRETLLQMNNGSNEKA